MRSSHAPRPAMHPPSRSSSDSVSIRASDQHGVVYPYMKRTTTICSITALAVLAAACAPQTRALTTPTIPVTAAAIGVTALVIERCLGRRGPERQALVQ